MTAASAVAVIASVTCKRLRRGRTLWIGCAIAILPILFVLAAHRQGETARDAFELEVIVIAVLAALLVGATLGDEIEARTHTYLWSRPLPRWSVVAGKLVVVIPAVVTIVGASWVAASRLASGTMPPVQSLLALALCAVTVSLLASAITLLAPKHGMALTICYMLFYDAPAGLMPVSIRYAAITEQVRLASGLGRAEGSAASGIIGLVIIGVICGLLAAWRARKLEA